MVETVVCGLEEDQLGQGLEGGDVGLGAFGETGPCLAKILHVPGFGEPASDPDRVSFGAGVGGGHANKAWWICQGEDGEKDSVASSQ